MKSILAILVAAGLCLVAGSTADARPRAAVIKKSSKVRKRPRKKSKTRFRVVEGERVVVLKVKRKWVKIAAGRKRGWIRRSRIHVSGSGWLRDDEPAAADDRIVIPSDAELAKKRDAEPDEELDQEPGADEPAPPPRPDGFASELAASLGFVGYASRFASDGATALGAYEISAGAMGAGIGGRAGLRRGKLSAAIDGRYRIAVGAPGIRFHRDDGSEAAANRFTIHELDASVVLGFAIDRDIEIAARGGFHAGTFWIDELQDNPGLIARERLTGPTAGAELGLRLSAELRLAAYADVLIEGKLRQTENLEDGMDSKVRGVAGGAEVSYRLNPDLALAVSYRGRRTWFDFSGPSARLEDVTTAERTDQTHALAIAASRSF